MRVLVATDGSAPAQVGIDLVRALPWPDGTEILVIEAIQTGPGLFGGPWPSIALLQGEELEEAARAMAQQTVDAARDQLSRPGLTVHSAVVVGRPPEAILEQARTMGADLIVLGSRGHGAIETMLLGSVATEVVEKATTPVLVARSTAVSTVVLAWDGSEPARRAAGLLEAWPLFRESRIIVVSVAEVDVPWWIGIPDVDAPQTLPVYLEAVDAARAEHDRLAREMSERLRSAGLDAHPERREGDPGGAILAAAEDHGAQLVVMGTHGRTGLARILLGSVARNVVQHAPCSVLVVRQPADDDSSPDAS